MNSDEIKEKIKAFLEKKSGLEKESCYFLTKQLNEDYWDEIQNEGIEEVEEDFDDFDADAEIPPLDIPQPKPKKPKPFIKKPKVVIKKDDDLGLD